MHGSTEAMRQLFLKIFASVLLTVLFTAAVSFVIAMWLMPRPLQPPLFAPHPPAGRSPHGGAPPADVHTGRDRLGDLLAGQAPLVQAAIRDGRLQAALKQTDALADRWGIRTYLLDETGTDLRGRALSSAARALAAQMPEPDEVRTLEGEHRVAVAVGLRAADGAPLVLVGEAPEMSPGPPTAFAWMTVLRLGCVALGLGLVCYFIARYITAPVLTLRAALRRFGEGDLEQRVGASIGRRRDEIGELARDFDQMAERIATLLSAQRRLLQDISHELRSPLARQRVALELVRQQDGGNTAKALDRAEREAERLDELIGELLTLSRLESNADGAMRSPVDLVEVIREVLENAEFEAHNCTRRVLLVEYVPCVVTGMRELLRRAIENVVRNALAYTAEESTVEVSLHQDASAVVILVRDHGPGVPDGELTDIFRPFYRVSRARERKTGGAGLGLAIAVRAVHSHGGSIVAANHRDGGLVVEIRLPRGAPSVR